MSASLPLILVVDDDPDFVEMHQTILETAGYRVVTAYDPEEALTVAGQERPDLLVTDLMMSHLDSGFGLARRLQQAVGGERRLPVVVITSVGARRGFDFSPQRAEDLQAMGMDAYFAKPVRPEALLGKIRELLAAR